MGEASEFLSQIFNGSKNKRHEAKPGTGLNRLLEGLVSDCGEEDCPLHEATRKPAPQSITQEMLEGLNSRGALSFATASAASAHNALALGRLPLAKERRKLSMMWLDVADALSDQEDADGSNPALDELESVRLQLREMISDRDAALDHIAQLRDINRSLRSQLAEELESLKSRSEENHQLSATNIQLAAQVMDLKAKLEVAEDVKNLIEDSAE